MCQPIIKCISQIYSDLAPENVVFLCRYFRDECTKIYNAIRANYKFYNQDFNISDTLFMHAVSHDLVLKLQEERSISNSSNIPLLRL